MSELVVTVNAPGEVAGYLLPLAFRLKALDPGLVIRAVVTPCPFAGGREREALEASGVLDEVVSLGNYLRRAVRLRVTRRARIGETLVLHLGGDRLYSLLIARLVGAPAWVYGTSRHASRRYDRCLVPDARTTRKLARSGVSEDRIVAVGEMVVDSVPDAIDSDLLVRRLELDPARDEIVTLMAGSRPYEVEFMVPFYAGVLDELSRARPAARCLLPVSPFVDRAALDKALAQAGLTVEGSRHGCRVRTQAGATGELVQDSPYAAMAIARLAVTLPGTNTLQLAALGVPTLLIAPLNRVETIVVEGPINWLSARWGPTRALKRHLLFRMSHRLPSLALPNIIGGRPIVPEMRGILTPAQVACEIGRWLDDAEGRRRMSLELREVAGPRGAAQRMATEVLSWERELCASGS